MHSCNCRISRGFIGWGKKVAQKTEHTKEACKKHCISPCSKGFTLEISGFILVSWWANPYRISPMALAYCTPYSWLQSWACEFQPLLTLLNSCVIESRSQWILHWPKVWPPYHTPYLMVHMYLFLPPPSFKKYQNLFRVRRFQELLLVQPAKCRIQLRPLELLQSPKV